MPTGTPKNGINKSWFKKGHKGYINSGNFKKGHIPWNMQFDKIKKIKKICKCGCGQEIKVKKWCVSYGVPDYIRGHWSKINNGGGRFKKGIISWSKGLSKKNSKILEKLSLKVSETLKSNYKDKEWKEKVLKKMFNSLDKRPTGYEKIIINIVKKHNLPYKYVGDGSFLIGYKNPDFINTNGEKIALEVYYDYHKIKNYGSVENYKNVRSNHFNKYGWKTIFISNNEIRNERKIISIIGGK